VPVINDDGFFVDPAHLQGVAGQIGAAYDDVWTGTTQFSGDYPSSGDFGAPVADAWSFFDSQWAEELQTFGVAITEMITKVQAAGAGYAKADARTAGAVKDMGG
jgi:hypothetical protein